MNTPINRKVLLTGLISTSNKAADAVKEYKAEPIVFPLLKTVQLSCSFKESYDWIVFTSPAAVRHFFATDKQISFDRTACIGAATKDALLTRNIKVDLMPEHYNSVALTAKLKSFDLSGQSVLYPCSEMADNTLEELLGSQCEFHRVNLYTLKKTTKKDLPEFTDAVFFSASGVEVMYHSYGSQSLKGTSIAAIGNKTAKALQKLFGISPIVPNISTAESAVKALLEL